ncbi:helix-turn-helix domain-containing protein [Pseudorhodoferax sp. Leaf265]|uniref:helix-turn-helix domain-containing protein n=1 Tax=Pseudorhodoferax sp. Leaf265 TaxID=1736315 RepID=UPI0012E892A8|nr:helix-turn-helix transcriptional regulator [Pseudorhodoferax sp. Leaf265]
MPSQRKPPPPSHAFGRALRAVRVARGLPQDATSGRTYISAIERGLKTPTLGKVDGLAAEFGVHPMTLLALAYSASPSLADVQRLFQRAIDEVGSLDIQQFSTDNLPAGAKPSPHRPVQAPVET